MLMSSRGIPSPHIRRRQRTGDPRRTGWASGLSPACALAALVLLASGCRSLGHRLSDGWHADYSKAEARARTSDRDLLMYYANGNAKRTARCDSTLDSERVRPALNEYVLLRLVKSHEPDRRYVAQFGVARAPAVIVARTDGTYHSRVGDFSEDALLQFLDSAQKPGLQPQENPLVPRRAAYQWHDELRPALAEAGKRHTAVMVVYYRSWSRDWPKIGKLLGRHEVVGRMAELVHCRIKIRNPMSEAYVTPFGSLRLPAFVVARSDGSFDTLETPTSYESVVRFLDQRHISGGAGAQHDTSRGYDLTQIGYGTSASSEGDANTNDPPPSSSSQPSTGPSFSGNDQSGVDQ